MVDIAQAEIWQRWKSALDFALKDTAYIEWLNKAEKISARYRDDRKNPSEIARRRMNILWSNVQTLLPATYGKMPKPIVERRYMDRDPAARLASTILERCLGFQMEVGYYHESTKQAVVDWLLPGMGQTWVRYEPRFEPAVDERENATIERENTSPEDDQENGDGSIYEKLSFEKVCVDYVFYRDFLWGSARFWNEVPWVARRSWMTRSEIAERFFQGDMEQAKNVTLDFTPERKGADANESETVKSYFKKAEVWEIWNKADQTVYFIPTGTPNLVLGMEKNPQLQLEGFWPCPKPLFATQTNETLVPVPDYVEYQDQAAELDDLTARISALTTALRANGVYDASFPALARILQDGQDNKLVPVDQWAAFAEKGGMAGAISLIPIKEIAEVLIGLYQARAQVKNDLYEVTGMSDIIRGQGDKNETATAQRIKGQFASMRLEDRRGEVARFCRDNLAIMAEIVAEQFSEESLMQMSGYNVMIEDQIREAVDSVPPPQPPQQAQDMPPAQLQMMQQQAMAQFEQAKQQAAMQAQQKALGEFQRALQILRSDRLRGFRVDIETDSTIAADAEADKAAATQLVTATFQGLANAGQIVMQAPELIQPIGNMLMFAFRRFRVGRTLEASLEDALDKIEKRMEQQAGQPKPPSPEQVKAEAEIAKQKAESERDAQNHQMEMQSKQADLQMDQQRNAMEMDKMRAELAIEQARLQMEREKLAIEREGMVLKAQIDSQKLQQQGESAQMQHMMKLEQAEHGHDLNMQTMDAKAQAAQQQAKAKPKEKA